MVKRKISERSLANLRPAFKKGQSGNPRGCPPREKQIPEILRRIGRRHVCDFRILPQRLQKAFGLLGNDITMLEAVCVVSYLCALKGEPWAVDFIAERTEGKVTQSVELNYKDKTDEDIIGIIIRLSEQLSDNVK
jgi:hypothetical protein